MPEAETGGAMPRDGIDEAMRAWELSRNAASLSFEASPSFRAGFAVEALNDSAALWRELAGKHRDAGFVQDHDRCYRAGQAIDELAAALSRLGDERGEG